LGHISRKGVEMMEKEGRERGEGRREKETVKFDVSNISFLSFGRSVDNAIRSSQVLMIEKMC
jgi:hypothetical protein